MDTNIVIDYIANKIPQAGSTFLERIKPQVSAATFIEALGWYKATPAQLEPIHAFMRGVVIFPVGEQITMQAISARQQKRMLLGDAIIAATALAHNLTLITRNIKDFAGIPGLSLMNPWEL